MRIIFIFKQTDSFMLIKALYEMALWIMENRDINIIFYVPDKTTISLFKGGKLDLRWIGKSITGGQVPAADVIISSDLELLEKLSTLNRGGLLYLKKNNEDNIIEDDSIKIWDIANSGVGIPRRFFLDEEKREKKVIIGGDRLKGQELEKIILAIEKAAPSFYADEILIISPTKDINIDTTLDYRFISEEELNFCQVLKKSFYMIWVAKDTYPIIPLWAMAAGVLVIGVNYSNISFEYPIEIKNLESMELALELMKTYKIGQYRNRLLISSKDAAKRNKMELIAGEWSSILEGILKGKRKDDRRDQISLTEAGDNNDYLLDIIVCNDNFMKTKETIENMIKNTKKFIDVPHRIYVIGKNKEFDRINLKNQKNVVLIKGKENYSYTEICNKAILEGNGRYILLLNACIRFQSNFIEPLLEIVKEDDVAVVGPQVIDKEGRIIDGGVKELRGPYKGRSSQEDLYEDSDVQEQVDVLGFNEAPLLIKKDLLPIIGLMDERFQAGYEKLDYTLRAREKGYRVVYCPDSKVEISEEAEIEDINLDKEKNSDTSRRNSKQLFDMKWADIINGSEKRREAKRILVVGLSPWNYHIKRSQQIVKNLVKLGYQVLYINPICSAESSLVEVEDNIYVYTPPGTGTVLYNIENEREQDIGSAITKLVHELEFNNCIAFINASYWLPILKYIEYSVLVYDCINNYIMYDYSLNYINNLEASEEQIFYLSDLVLSSSNELYQQTKQHNDNTYLLPNAFDREQYSSLYQPTIIPEDIPVGEKIVGYYGPITGDFDIDLVKASAEKYQGVVFVIIGEVYTDVSSLVELNNVIFTGSKVDDIIPDYLYYFDLAVIPYKINNRTISLNPHILYEYLAAGKRILTTRLPEVEKFAGEIEIVDNHETFIDKMGQLLSSENLEEERVSTYKTVQKDNWYNRTKSLSKMIHLAYYDLYLNEDEEEFEMEDEGDIYKEGNIAQKDLLKISSLEGFNEDEEINVEVKDKESLITKIKNFFKKAF